MTKNLHELELENGYIVQVEYDYSEPELGYDGTGFNGGVTVNHIWTNLFTNKNELVTVDILHFLSQHRDVDIQILEEQIEEKLKD